MFRALRLSIAGLAFVIASVAAGAGPASATGGGEILGPPPGGGTVAAHTGGR